MAQDGWAALGSALGGAPTGAYEDQLLRNYRTQGAAYSRDKVMEEATLARNKRIALEGIGPAIQTLGLDPALTPFFQGDPNSLSKTALDLGEFNTRGQARNAALGGDLATANANLMSLGGPQALTKVQGDVAFNPMAAPDQPMYATPLGGSRVAERQAAANRSNAAAQRELALAGKYDAQAALGGFAPRAVKPTATIVPDNGGAVGAPAMTPLGTPPNTYTSPTDVVFVDPAADVLPLGPGTRADILDRQSRSLPPAEKQRVMGEAQIAIERGAPRAAVIARLKEAYGIDWTP